MSHNTSPILVALSGSILLVMLVSVLGIVPRSTTLQANILAPIREERKAVTDTERESIYDMFSARTPEEIRTQIYLTVSENKPDEAKKLYDELYLAEKYKR